MNKDETSQGDRASEVTGFCGLSISEFIIFKCTMWKVGLVVSRAGTPELENTYPHSPGLHFAGCSEKCIKAERASGMGSVLAPPQHSWGDPEIPKGTSGC